jgi:HK97 gp10 family phage protein
MANAGVIVTGDKELDRRLAQFEARVQRKYIRQAVNNAVKVVETKARANVPVDTGAMQNAIVRRTPKRQKRGVISRGLWITRRTLARAIRGVAIGKARKQFKGVHGAAEQRALAVVAAKETTVDIEQRGFYPSFVELGDKDSEGKRPLRNALYGSQAEVRKEFIDQLRTAVATAGK